MKQKLSALTLAFALIFISSTARAVPIDYIFNGTGEGTLNGIAFDGAFTVTIDGDTSGINAPSPGFLANPGTATFTSGALTATISNAEVYLAAFDPSNANIGFGQTSPGFDLESLVNPAFATYGLGPLGTTGGTVSAITQTYATNVGNLIFNDVTGAPPISSMTFEAIEPSTVPLPASLPMMLAALAGLGGFALLRRREVRA